jgi:multiple sugar transport system substrate-binding protein
MSMTMRGTTRRRMLGTGAVGAGVVGLLAAACGGPGASGTGGSGGAPAASKAPARLRLLARTPQEEDALNAQLPNFMKQFPHITVETEFVAGGDMIVKQQTMAASDTMPDNAHSYVGNQTYHQFAITGAYRQIDDLIARDKVDLKQWFPELVEIMKIDGKMYALPFKGQVLGAGFFYNQSLFEKRGIAPPNDNWTMDDLIKAAQQLTERQGSETVQWGYAVATWGGENLQSHLRAFNADAYSRDGKKSTLDTAQALEAFQWYENLFQRERTMHPLANAVNSFVEGKVAMIGRTYFNLKTNDLLPRVQGKFKWDGTMMPKHAKTGKRGGMFSGDVHAISKAGKSPDAAFELCKFLCGKEFGVALGLQKRGSTTLGGRPDVYADERILNHPELSKQMQQAQLKSVQEIKEPYSGPANFKAPDVERIRDPEITKLTTGEAKAEAGFLRSLNTQLQAILDQPR